MGVLIGSGILILCVVVGWIVLRRPVRQIFEDVHVDHARALFISSESGSRPVSSRRSARLIRPTACDGRGPSGTMRCSGRVTGSRDTCWPWYAFTSTRARLTSSRGDGTRPLSSSFARANGGPRARAWTKCVPTRQSAATSDLKRSWLHSPTRAGLAEPGSHDCRNRRQRLGLEHVSCSFMCLVARHGPELDVLLERKVSGAAEFQDRALQAFDFDACVGKTRCDLMRD